MALRGILTMFEGVLFEGVFFLKKFPWTTQDYSGQTAGLFTTAKMDVMCISTVQWELNPTNRRCENINARVKKISWMLSVTVATVATI